MMTECSAEYGVVAMPKPERWPSAHRARIMLFCAAGASLVIILDANIVAVSLPSIARGEFTDVEWVVSAYIPPFAALPMPARGLADRLGRRRILRCALSIFTVASLLCGLAPGLSALNGAPPCKLSASRFSSAMAVIGHAFQAPRPMRPVLSELRSRNH